VALVSHQNGYRHDLRPLADLAHAYGAWLYTDAIQAAGMIPIDVRAADVDVLCAGTYKWLLAGFGTAPLYVRKELLDRIQPDRWGALHVAKDLGSHRYEIHRSAKKFEYATLAFGAVYQLGAGLAYLEKVGVPRIEAHTVSLAHQLRDGLVARGFDLLTPPQNRSSIVSVRNPAAAGVAQRTFRDAGIEVSFRENGTQIRVSPALFNTSDDVAAVLRTVDPLAPRR
jgi:selenocysteine lyase/cysteine desulfurase